MDAHQRAPEGADALHATIRAALLTPSPLTRYRPGPHRRRVDGNVVLLGEPDFRHVLVLGPATPEQVFALATACFDGATDYSIEVLVELAGAVEQALLARGWRLDEEEPVLVLPTLPTRLPPLLADLAIRPVVTEAGLAEFFAVSGSGGRRWVPSLAAATDPAVALFVGAVDGRPVATSRLTCLGTVAEITGVTTQPEYRRRGCATALTWAAVAEGSRRGCTSAVLTATAMGYPVYRRMGFQPAGTFRTYLPPGHPAEG